MVDCISRNRRGRVPGMGHARVYARLGRGRQGLAQTRHRWTYQRRPGAGTDDRVRVPGAGRIALGRGRHVRRDDYTRADYIHPLYRQLMAGDGENGKFYG